VIIQNNSYTSLEHKVTLLVSKRKQEGFHSYFERLEANFFINKNVRAEAFCFKTKDPSEAISFKFQSAEA